MTIVHSCFEEAYFFPDKWLKNRVGKLIFQRTLSISDKVIFVSEAGRKSYEAVFKLRREKCCVVYNGIGKEILDAGKDAAAYLPDTFQISYIGRLSPVKGIHLLIEAVSILADRYPLCLSIVGEGEAQDALKHQVQALGIASLVTFHGKQMDVLPFLRKTNIFVYPSVWQEVFGISVVEAMAFGKLCITNSVGGLPEIILDGVNGFLTETISAEGVAQRIEDAINSYKDGSYKAISQEAKRTANIFSIQNTVESLNQVYSSLLC